MARLIYRLTCRLWAWRLRQMRCVACGDFVDRIEIHDGGDRILARCSDANCGHWSDWRR
jgi:hypothetical protein